MASKIKNKKLKYKKQRYTYSFIENKKNDKNIESEVKIKIPSVEYPLNENNPQLFTSEKTKFLEDETIKGLIDQVSYKIGQCYTNSNSIMQLLRKHKIKAEVYVGWLCVGLESRPIHHAWVIVQNKYLIDVSDDTNCFLFNLKNMEIDANNLSKEEIHNLYVDFLKIAVEQKIVNSQRCHLGLVSKDKYYIGCPCDYKLGIKIFNKLTMNDKNNIYTREGTDEKGRSELQQKLFKEGLLSI